MQSEANIGQFFLFTPVANMVQHDDVDHTQVGSSSSAHTRGGPPRKRISRQDHAEFKLRRWNLALYYEVGRCYQRAAEIRFKLRKLIGHVHS